MTVGRQQIPAPAQNWRGLEKKLLASGRRPLGLQITQSKCHLKALPPQGGIIYVLGAVLGSYTNTKGLLLRSQTCVQNSPNAALPIQPSATVPRQTHRSLHKRNMLKGTVRRRSSWQMMRVKELVWKFPKKALK